MPRPIWSGAISFGLLNVPVQLYPAERTVDLKFHMIDNRNKKRIRYERVNAETGEEVPWKQIVKAFEYSKGHYVVIDEDDIRKAAPEVTETVEIETFVKRESIDSFYFEKPYYLVPGKRAEKGYVLLRELLKKTGRVGIARVVIRTRQYLAMLDAKGDALALTLLRFPQEIVPQSEYNFPEGNAGDYRVTPKELEMATALLESMAGEWNPSEYKDEFRSKLRKIIEDRVKKKGKTVAIEEPGEEPANAATNVVDFMALLEKSLKGKGAAKPELPARGPRKTAKRASTRKRASRR